MQSLWFRTAQTRSSCHCITCVKIGTLIARQTSNAIGKRRRVSIGDIFTACYSTILATAAVADSNQKARRREQWDQLIAEAKAGTAAGKVEEAQDGQTGGITNEAEGRTPDIPGESTFSGSQGTNLYFSRPEFNSLKAGHTVPKTWDGVSWAPVSSIVRLEKHLNAMPSNIADPVESSTPPETPQGTEESSAEPVPETTTELLVDGKVLGEHIPTNSMLQPREPKNMKQLGHLERAITKLVHDLMWTTKLSPIGADIHSAPSDIFLETERMIERVEQLQHSDITMPVYQLNAQVRKNRCHLHVALKALLKNASPGHINLNLILAKICYNLLISSTSPNVFTYNFLIEKLTELMLHDHAQVFVDSFLHNTLFRPTSKTIQVMLNHYASKDDLEGYRSIIWRMRAIKGSMAISRRHKDQLERSVVLRWAEKHANRLTLRDGWLQRKVPRDASIFDTLIKTSLRVMTSRQSVFYIRAALRRGNEIQPELLVEAVTNCVAQVDHAAGDSLLRSILEVWDESVPKPFLVVLTKSTRWAIRELLHLCGIDPTQDLPRLLPVDVPRWSLGRLLFHLKLGTIRDAVDRSVYRIHSLQIVLQVRPPKIPKVTELEAWRAEFGDEYSHDFIPKKFGPRNHQREGHLSKREHVNKSRQRINVSPQRRVVLQNLDRAFEIFDNFSITEDSRARKLTQRARQARRVMLQSLESKVNLSKANVLRTERRLLSWHYYRLPRDWRYTYHLRLRESPFMPVPKRFFVLIVLERLRKLHVLDYKVNQSLQQIILMKKEINRIRGERERRLLEFAAKVTRNAKQIRHIERQIRHIGEKIQFRSLYSRLSGLREMKALDKEIKTSKRQIKSLGAKLKRDFPQVDPARRLRELNLILFKVNKSKQQVRSLADEISLARRPVRITRRYATSKWDIYKPVRKFRKELSFQYDPPAEKLLSSEDQGYEIIETSSIEHTLRLKELEEHIPNETVPSAEWSDSSIPDTDPSEKSGKSAAS